MASCWVCLFFFFSSRRRHTRLQGDWSSDVCSSDLLLVPCHLASLPSQQSSSQVIPSQGAPSIAPITSRGRARSRSAPREPCSASSQVCPTRSEEHTSELQSPCNLVCRLLLEKKKKKKRNRINAILTRLCSMSITKI